ncbi:MAG: hypothetical protein ACYCS9_05610 [Candidatus Dormibacteria bacterium]
MPASAYKTSAWSGINREKVRLARPELVPLIGEEAFKYAQRPAWVLKFSVLPFVAVIGLAVGVGLSHGTIAVVLGAIGWTLVGAMVTGVVLYFHWAFKASRLANAKLSADLGFPIKVRGGGGGIDPQDWARAIEQAKQRYWQEHPEAKAGNERTDGSDG